MRADDFAKVSPPPLPVLPDWSPVKEYGGYYRLGSTNNDDRRMHSTAVGTGLHFALDRQRELDYTRVDKALWGSGCECFAF